MGGELVAVQEHAVDQGDGAAVGDFGGPLHGAIRSVVEQGAAIAPATRIFFLDSRGWAAKAGLAGTGT